jgi:hypothetical protein
MTSERRHRLQTTSIVKVFETNSALACHAEVTKHLILAPTENLFLVMTLPQCRIALPNVQVSDTTKAK